MIKGKGKTLLAALAVMLLWGFLFPAVKLGYQVYKISTVGDILLFAGVRFLVCGGVICAFAGVRDRKSFLSVQSAMVPVLLSGLFAIILHYAFTYIGLNLTDSSKTAILKQLGALVYSCFSFVFFQSERFSVRKIIAAIIGFCGIVVINLDGGGFKFGIGDVFIILASFCTVASNIVSKKALRSVKPVTMTGVSQLFGGAVLGIVGLLLGGKMEMSFANCGVFALICTASIFSYCLWFTVVKDGDLSHLFIIKFSEPVFAAIFGAVILQSNIFNLQYLAAFLLISLGIWIANTAKAKSP